MGQARQVLVVDDSPTLRAAVDFVLSRAGFEVKQATNGREALDLLEETSRKGEIPALIISDIHMPQVNGIEFIRRVKESPLRFVPILVLTTERGEEMKKQAKEAGAAGWINKPFDEQDLIAAARRLTALPWKRGR